MRPSFACIAFYGWPARWALAFSGNPPLYLANKVISLSLPLSIVTDRVAGLFTTGVNCLLFYYTDTIISVFITFCMRHSRGEMYIGLGRLYICVSVCASPHSHTTPRTRM